MQLSFHFYLDFYFIMSSLTYNFFYMQRRSGGVSQQRLGIEDSKIVLGVRLLGVAQVLTIQCFVTRVLDPSFQRSDVVNEPVELEVKALQEKVGEV